jgi:hypothetical protein
MVNAVYRLVMVRPIRGAKHNMTTLIKAMVWSISGRSMALSQGHPRACFPAAFYEAAMAISGLDHRLSQPCVAFAYMRPLWPLRYHWHGEV